MQLFIYPNGEVHQNRVQWKSDDYLTINTADEFRDVITIVVVEHFGSEQSIDVLAEITNLYT